MSPRADGPDVSHYQTVIAESAIPAFQLASCKLGEGRSYFDPTAPSWIALFRRNGVRNLGVYYWVRSDSLIESQFFNMVARLRQCGLDHNGVLEPGVFLQLDWETTPNIAPLTVAQVEEFVTLTQRRYGDRMIVYSSDWVPGFTTWRARNPETPLWYANYNQSTAPTGGRAECAKYRASVWQWTSTYKCPGIAGGIDMNEVCAGGWEVLDHLCNLDVEQPQPDADPVLVQISAALAATGGDMQLRIIADARNKTAPERWITNGLVRVAGTEHSIDWLVRTMQVVPGQTIRNPEFIDPLELAGIPVVAGGG